MAEDNDLAKRSLAVLERKLRDRGLSPKVITGHTGWSDDLDFVFAHKEQVCNSMKKQKPHDPAAPYDGYDEKDDTEERARKTRFASADSRRKRRVLVFGAGVIGSYLAHVLYEAGNEVTILSRRERMESLNRNGLINPPKIGHAVNLWCDRALSITPNGKITLVTMKEIDNLESMAKLYEGVDASVPMKSAVFGVMSLVLQFFGYFSIAYFVWTFSEVFRIILYAGSTVFAIFGSGT